MDTILGVVGIFIDFVKDRKDAYYSVGLLSRSMATAVDNEFCFIAAGLNGLPQSKALRAGDFSAFRPQAENFVKAQFVVANLVIFDASGQIVFSLQEPANAGSPKASAFAQTIQTFDQMQAMEQIRDACKAEYSVVPRRSFAATAAES